MSVHLVREQATYVHTLVVDIHEWEGKWRVRVVGRCDEKSPMPESFEWLPGGKSEHATRPFLERAVARFRKAGWLDTLSAESLARVELRLAKIAAAAAARARDYQARVAAFPTSALDNQLAAAIAKPKGVTRLELRGDAKHRLTAIPSTIKRLVDLEVLHLEGNALPELPDEIGKIKSLRELHLADNALTELPAAAWFLSRLVVLNLHGNQLREISRSVGDYQKKGLVLQIAGNPLEARPELSFDKLGSLGIDTEQLFPIEDTTSQPLAALDLYGRAPTKRELEVAKRAFPKAKIEHVGKLADVRQRTPHPSRGRSRRSSATSRSRRRLPCAA